MYLRNYNKKENRSSNNNEKGKQKNADIDE